METKDKMQLARELIYDYQAIVTIRLNSYKDKLNKEAMSDNCRETFDLLIEMNEEKLKQIDKFLNYEG